MRLASPASLALGLSLALATAAAGGAPGPTGDHPLDGVILDTRTGERLTPDALAEKLAAADIAILGEVHDNPEQHRRQAWAIRRIAPSGIAFEMVPEAAESGIAALDPAERFDRLPELLDWEASGWPDWQLYRPVFEAAGAARIIGGGVARERLMQAVKEGAAAAHGTGAAEAGLEETLPDEVQATLEAEMVASHCDALPPEMAPGMVEAQRLRDARFAAAAVRALDAGGRAVLVTGNGHARTDHGVPRYLARLRPDSTVLSLGQIEVEADALTVADYAEQAEVYDFLWFSDRAEREDPCEDFEIRK